MKRPHRVNISIDKVVLERIDKAAREAGESRSLYLTRAGLARINRSPHLPRSKIREVIRAVRAVLELDP